MPLLATWIGALFTQLVAYLTVHMTAKAAFAVAAIITFGLLTNAVYVAIALILNGLTYTFPAACSGLCLAIVNVVLPPVLPGLIAFYIGADTAIALYKWNVTNLKLASHYVT